MKKILILPVMFIILAACAFAAYFPVSKDLIILSVPIHDDLYAAGAKVIVNAPVKGDLIVAASDIEISGNVSDDVIAAGGSVSILAPVKGDLRVAGGSILIEKDVFEDVVASGGEITLLGSVAGDAVLSGGDIRVSGNIGRNLQVNGGSATLDGFIQGNLTAYVGNLIFGPDAYVNGDLIITSESDIDVNQDKVGGNIIRKDIPHVDTPSSIFVLGFFAKAFGVIGLLIVGLLLIFVFDKATSRIVSTLKSHPWKCLGFGLLVLIAVPALAILLLLMIVTIPLSIILMVLFVIAIYLSQIFVAYIMGSLILYHFKKASHYLMFVVGMIAYSLIKFIPVFGDFFSFFAICFGLGALTISLFHWIKPKKKVKK